MNLSLRMVGLSVLAIGAIAATLLIATNLFGTDASASAMASPVFVEEAAQAGVRHVYDGEFSFFVGGGVAAFDCNDDGLPDLYFAGGANPAALYVNESQGGGELRFRHRADPAYDLDGVTGAYPIDVDGDDHVDLAVLRRGENVLLRGEGDCSFARANDAWRIDGGDELTTAFSATWEQGHDLPTLAFGNYVALNDEADQAVGCSDHALIRPDGSGYGSPVALRPGWCSLSILFSDWGRNGQVDLRMANDRHYYRGGQEQLWRIQPGAPPEMYDPGDGWGELQIWGMGIASRDVTGDGYPEVFLTSMGDNKLQTLTGDGSRPSYEDMALEAGVTAHRPYAGVDAAKPSTAWHAEFDDVNNDGYVDLFISKGNVDAMTEAAGDDPNNLLLGREDGTFVESAAAAGVVNEARTRGAALVDLNLDGMLDLVEVNRREPVTIRRNVGWGDAADPAPMGNWLAIELSQPGGNADAIGAWIEVRVAGRQLTQEVTIGGGHAGGQLGWNHFGLGAADRAEVRVVWPDGQEGPWMEVAANQHVIVMRGASEPLGWRPGSG